MKRHFFAIAGLLLVTLILVLMPQTPPAQAAPDVTTNCATQTQIPQAECVALKTMYNSTGGPSWSDSPGNGWNLTQTPCSWTGITCSGGSPRHVARIEREEKSLSGTLPGISALTKLEVLNLDFNSLGGGVPNLSAHVNLREIYLSRNHLNGTVPNISALTNLVVLSLGGNQLGGPLPNLSVLIKLEHVDLSRARFAGTIPDLSNLTHLQELFLNENQLSGPLPKGLCNAQGRVDLNFNMLSGDFPTCFTDTGPGSANTQTLPPTNLSSHALSATSFHLDWTPIRYTEDGGYYEVLCGDAPGGPYTSRGTTETTGGKSATSFIVTGLTPGTQYFCMVRTFTPKHFDFLYQQNDLTSEYSAEVLAPAFYNGGENRLSVAGWQFDSQTPSASGALSDGGLRIDVTAGPARACWYQDIDGAPLRNQAVRLEAEMRKARNMNQTKPPFTNPYISLQVRKGDGSWNYNFGGILNSRSVPGGPWISEARDILLPGDMTTLRAAFCVWNATPGTAQTRYPLLRLVVTPPPPSANLLAPEWTWTPATTGLNGSGSGGTMQINVANAGAQGCWIQDLAGAHLQGQKVHYEGSLRRSAVMNSSKGFVNPYISLQVRQSNGQWLYNYGGTLNATATPGSFGLVGKDIVLPSDMITLRAAFCVWDAAPGTASGRSFSLKQVMTAQGEETATETWEEAEPETPSVLPEDGITMEQIEFSERLWLPSLRGGSGGGS